MNYRNILNASSKFWNKSGSSKRGTACKKNQKTRNQISKRKIFPQPFKTENSLAESSTKSDSKSTAYSWQTHLEESNIPPSVQNPFQLPPTNDPNIDFLEKSADDKTKKNQLLGSSNSSNIILGMASGPTGNGSFLDGSDIVDTHGYLDNVLFSLDQEQQKQEHDLNCKIQNMPNSGNPIFPEISSSSVEDSEFSQEQLKGLDTQQQEMVKGGRKSLRTTQSIEKSPKFNYIFSKAEDCKVIQSVKQIGYKWAEIAKLIPGQNEAMIKHRYNTQLKNRLSSNINDGRSKQIFQNLNQIQKIENQPKIKIFQTSNNQFNNNSHNQQTFYQNQYFSPSEVQTEEETCNSNQNQWKPNNNQNQSTQNSYQNFSNIPSSNTISFTNNNNTHINNISNIYNQSITGNNNNNNNNNFGNTNSQNKMINQFSNMNFNNNNTENSNFNLGNHRFENCNPNNSIISPNNISKYMISSQVDPSNNLISNPASQLIVTYQSHSPSHTIQKLQSYNQPNQGQQMNSNFNNYNFNPTTVSNSPMIGLNNNNNISQPNINSNLMNQEDTRNIYEYNHPRISVPYQMVTQNKIIGFEENNYFGCSDPNSATNQQKSDAFCPPNPNISNSNNNNIFNSVMQTSNPVSNTPVMINSNNNQNNNQMPGQMVLSGDMQITNNNMESLIASFPGPPCLSYSNNNNGGMADSSYIIGLPVVQQENQFDPLHSQLGMMDNSLEKDSDLRELIKQQNDHRDLFYDPPLSEQQYFDPILGSIKKDNNYEPILVNSNINDSNRISMEDFSRARWDTSNQLAFRNFNNVVQHRGSFNDLDSMNNSFDLDQFQLQGNQILQPRDNFNLSHSHIQASHHQHQQQQQQQQLQQQQQQLLQINSQNQSSLFQSQNFNNNSSATVSGSSSIISSPFAPSPMGNPNTVDKLHKINFLHGQIKAIENMLQDCRNQIIKEVLIRKDDPGKITPITETLNNLKEQFQN